MIPTVGRIVHYHLIDTGKVVPAIICDVRAEHVDLFIMNAGHIEEFLPPGTWFERQVLYSVEPAPGRWSWPPKV